jgi:hypothetical protein
MKNIFITILLLVFNCGFSQINGTYKSKDGLYKLKITNYSKQNQSFNFVWEGVNPDDMCSCGGSGVGREDNEEPKKGEFYLTEEDPQGGFNYILKFNFTPDNTIKVKVMGNIDMLWGCGNGCRIGNEIFNKVVPKKTIPKKK